MINEAGKMELKCWMNVWHCQQSGRLVFIDTFTTLRFLFFWFVFFAGLY